MKTRGFEVVKGYEDKGINLPVRKTKHSAAYDIEAAEEVVLPSFQKGMKPTLIPTGLKAYMQSDEVLLIVPRSSGPKKQGISFPHNVGVIDSDYYNNPDNEGHIFVQCINLKDEDVVIKKGEAVAQAIFQKYLTVDDDNAEGMRTGGFGSTDRKDR
ncbi:MAG TPA: dUTP diphosphatase [Candidatus Onthousia excrementipullorum]|uniref:dUTP diphosphatase n=1 Tax=Candidatus Onthousia excrementipullorum TaxID=2840884 RepID=A0A9D1DTG6_9FIRM|nr:dUTP diphosphatase [Candidatus Onthousia excrementipullorum]